MNVFDKVSQIQFAEITGMPVATQNFRRSRHPESLPPGYKFGRKIYYNHPDVMEWIESCRMDGGTHA